MTKKKTQRAQTTNPPANRPKRLGPSVRLAIRAGRLANAAEKQLAIVEGWRKVAPGDDSDVGFRLNKAAESLGDAMIALRTAKSELEQLAEFRPGKVTGLAVGATVNVRPKFAPRYAGALSLPAGTPLKVVSINSGPGRIVGCTSPDGTRFLIPRGHLLTTPEPQVQR